MYRRKIRREQECFEHQIDILGVGLFLYGCKFRDWNSVVPLLAIFAGLAVMLAGLLMGNRNKN